MKLRLILLSAFVGFFCCCAPAATPEETFVTQFLRFDLENAKKSSDAALARDPRNLSALFVRMEVAELQAQTNTVLDSALRLCNAPSAREFQEIASNRILHNAGNTKAFNKLLARIKSAAQRENGCTFNLRLALAAAADDGLAGVNLDQAAAAAGFLSRWHIAGPFGRYANAEFDRKWEPELNPSRSKTEEFLFRDGIISLPDYLTGSGILYASSEMQSAINQDFLLDVTSPGPYTVFLDGKAALTHDSRYMLQSGEDSAMLNVSAGKHLVLVKFTADAAPLRVALSPRLAAQDSAVPEPWRAYTNALKAWFRDDPIELERSARLISGRMASYLKALLYLSAEAHTAEARTAWEQIDSVPLARLRLAEMAMERGAVDDLTRQIMSDAQALPDYEPAQQNAFQALRSEEALKRLLAIHPSCAHLSEALSFFNSTGRQDEIQKIEDRLPGCAPESLDATRRLSAAGEHQRAVEVLRTILARNPLNRAARHMLVQELLLNNEESEAQTQAEKLHQIAPGSPGFTRLAIAPYEALDSKSSRAVGFTLQNEFYLPYRRDGLRIIRNSAERHFSGGPAVVLLSDKAVHLDQSGAVSIYIHRITRVLNKDGISRFGEVSLPRSADLLELRTVKANGQIIEPELTHQKPTISMPALEPGDSIEEELVTHATDWDAASEDAGNFTFGSFTAPILYSRFVMMVPEAMQLRMAAAKQIAAHSEHSGDNRVYVWEQDNIPQTTAEGNLPAENFLPSVEVAPVESGRARLRDELMDSARIGLRVLEVSRGFQQAATEQDKARRLYHFVTSKIGSSADWNTTTAEDTLLNSDGSRTAALLALGHALGLKSGLVLARRTGCTPRELSDISCYTEPLVRFWFADGKTLDVDAETGSVPFGAVSPALEAKDALLVPFTAPDFSAEARQFHTALTPGVSDEKSVAEGNLVLESSGDLEVELHVRLGVSRAQQVREILRNAGARERQAFFEQLAMRIFPGAGSVSGSSLHENDAEQPLDITLRCTMAQFLNMENDPADLDQLVPALGLRGLYAKSPTRRFPLYIDSVFFESAIFHLHLPAGLQVRSLPSEFTTHNEFGDYSVRFSSTSRQINIQRDFHIPVQVIASGKYEAFASFARQVDEAERRRISIRHVQAH